MLYDEYMTRLESNRKYLVNQVEEQSDLCDVVVKMGVWEKKFHRCVLVISPSFDRALKNNFLEKLKGKIELAIGTPSTLEMAIMFLYEKTPTFTGQNIEHIMNLAEFLLLPNLKSACISWLKSVPITEESCMKSLQLSGIYDFEMPSCDEYIISHMTEMLPHTVMNNVSVDSVKYMFSEKTLSYVPMDDRVIFLIRWANSRPTMREKYVKKLFEMIDFREVSKDVLDELKANQKMCDVIDFKQLLCHDEKETLNSHPVLIMLRCMREMTFWCFDLVREKWFRLDSKCHQKKYINRFYDISGAGFTNSEIYFNDCRAKRSNVLHLDLDTDTYKIYKLVRKDTGNDFNFRGFGDLIVFGDMYIAFVNEKILARKHIKSNLKSYNSFINSSTLYIGYRNDGNIEMSPKLSFKDYEISNLCINKMLTIAIIFRSRSAVSFFDL